MSQENVEVVGAAIEVFNRRDIGALAALSEGDPAEALEAVGLAE